MSWVATDSQMIFTNLDTWQRSRAHRSTETNRIARVDPDSALVTQPTMDLPWEQFIVSGPATVILLGELMVVASKLDFSFRDYQPDYTFVYIRYPKSFRATLTQIADDGWKAFMGAHSNMNKIQASMELIPKHVQTVLLMKNELAKLDQTIRSHYDEARESVRKAQAEYSRALKKIPTGFKALLLDLGRAVIGIVKTAGQALTGGGGGGMGSKAESGVLQTSGHTLTFARLFSDSLNKALPRIKQILSDYNNNQSTSNNPNEELEAYKVTFQTFLSSIATGKGGDLKEQVIEIIQQCISLLDETSKITKESLGPSENITQDVIINLKSRFDKLVEDIKPMVAAEAMNGAGVPPSA
ncbi:unnamed protein product, partial [Rotaria sordida]